MRTLVNVGLAWLLVLAPALCCCTVRAVSGRPPAPADTPPCPSTGHKSCCRAADPTPAPQPPHAPPPSDRHCGADLPDATTPETPPAVADPEPTGERLPVSALGPTAVPPEHLGLVRGLGPPERAGVDARSEALFSRHTLRC